MTDEQLMQSVSKGQMANAGVLYERYKKPIYNYFRKFGLGQDQSLDLAQSTFERMIKYRSSFDKGQNFKPWLYTIGRNVMYDYFAKSKNTSSIEGDIGEDTEPDIEENIENLKIALARVPIEYREILIMSRYEGLKYEEIAQMLEISLSNVKIRAFRAIKMLKSEYHKIL